MKDWYLRQSPRDRLIVVVVGILCLMGCVYAFVWFPFNEKLAQRRLNIENQKETLSFMHEGAAKLRANGGGVQQALVSNKAPYLLVDELIRKAGIKLPKSIEPTKSNGARVEFSEVEFDRLVGVIAELERYGLKVESINFSGKSAGLVSARINVEKS